MAVSKKKASVNRIAGNGAAAKEVKIRIEPLRIGRMVLPIVGTSELIVHRFDEKTADKIADKQAGTAKQKKGNRVPEDEYKSAFYLVSGSPGEKGAVYGIPAAGFKNAAVSACRFVDNLQMTLVRGSFFVKGDAKDSRTGVDLVRLHHKADPYMRRDTVRLSGPSKVADLRYRPAFPDWRCDLHLEYNEAILNPEQIVNLFKNAGFGIGVCEWRAEKNGSYGMFDVDISKLELA